MISRSCRINEPICCSCSEQVMGSSMWRYLIVVDCEYWGDLQTNYNRGHNRNPHNPYWVPTQNFYKWTFAQNVVCWYFYPTLTEHQYLCAVYCPVKHLLACYVEIEDEDGLLLRTFDNELRIDGGWQRVTRGDTWSCNAEMLEERWQLSASN